VPLSLGSLTWIKVLGADVGAVILDSRFAC
jgi:hypothetical protein